VFRLAVSVVLLGGLLAASGRAQTQPATSIPKLDEARFRSDLAALSNSPSRLVGSEGFYAAGSWIEEQFKAVPNLEWKKQTFPVMVPVTKSATLTLAGETSNVYPFWPAMVRLNTTPAEGITGTISYIAKNEYASFKPKSLQGQIAAIEARDASAWQTAAYFGAKAILVLGAADISNAELRTMEVYIPVNIPRFYVPPGPLADAIRAGKAAGNATLKASANWERRMATNYYAYVPGRTLRPPGWELDPIKADKDQKPPPGALCIAVPYDASSLVTDLAPGAGQAVQVASAMSMLRDIANAQLERPILFAFTGGDLLNYRATREMFMAFGDVPGKWSEALDDLTEQQRDADRDLAVLQKAANDPTVIDIVNDRGAIERVSNIIETDAILGQDRLFKLRTVAEGSLTPELIKERDTLEVQQQDLGTLRYAFQKKPKDLVGKLGGPAKEYMQRAITRLEGSTAPAKEGLITQFKERQRELQERIDLYHWLATKLGRPLNPRERDQDYRLIELMIGLDLSDAGLRCGPMYHGQAMWTASTGLIQNYRDWFIQLDRDTKIKDAAKPEELAKRDKAKWYADLKGLFDVGSVTEGREPPSWAMQSFNNLTELAPAWGVPGFCIITTEDLRLRRDTPGDTLANLNLKPILQQLGATREVIMRAWSEFKQDASGKTVPAFYSQQDYRLQRNGFEGQVVSPASGRPIPDLPREGFIATYYYTDQQRKIPKFRWVPWMNGVRRSEVAETDTEGRYRFEGLPRHRAELCTLGVEVYQTAPDTGVIIGSTDVGKQAGDIKIYADIRQDLDPLRSVVFKCTEYTLVGLYDPRFLQALGEMTPLDARRNAEPQRYNMLLRDQMLAAFVEPDMTSALVFRYGRIGNRLLLLNIEENAKAGSSSVADMSKGFTSRQIDDLGVLSLATAKDFWKLDDRRIEDYRRAGVSNTLIDSLHKSAKDQIAAADTAVATDDGASLIKNANGGWASETRVYQAAQDMASDVVRAAIFLLLLCVPFAFCMERLLIGTPNIYKQLTWLAVIFSLMTAALWSFHPAFKISASPLIIILAFAILFMSMTVIWVVYGKFDTELKRIRSGRGSAEGASFARASVLMSAVLLGIANMRKRKFRTGLTSLTIVLITFAVLCFTSSSSFLDTITLPTGVSPQYPGLLLRQRGFRPMPGTTPQNLQVLLPDVPLVQRWWNLNVGNPRDMIHVVAAGQPPKVFAAQAVLGLSPGESRLSSIAKVIGAEKFARLENGEQKIVYLSSAIADQLKVKEGGKVRIGGIELEVAGTFDADDFDQRVLTLSNEPLAPLKYSSGALDASGRKLDNNDAESLDLDADSTSSELASAYEHLSATQFVIVPYQISKLLPGATLRSLAFDLPTTLSTLSILPEPKLREIGKREVITGYETMPVNELVKAIVEKNKTGLNDPTSVSEALVKQVSDDLSKRLAVAMFAGFNDGVKLVSAGSGLPQVSGAGQVAVPLAIAGLIIFNTMMGSIAERRREIHVYTSLGLAPLHVGALFVAEAMTYGLIGTVFGYVIGQGVGTAMSKLGWLGSVTLNYSGTSAMVTMGLILLITLLSALVPARLASKIAAPSIERSWKVPMPKGDEIMAILPFTINKTAADGALAYLADFFDAHREGSIGKFSAGKVDAFIYGDDKGQESRGLKTVIWLTPFDLGVRQHLMLLIHPGNFKDVYEVQVVLGRLSGDDGNWYRMNRSFLTQLRKQFLQWRSLSPQRQLEFVEQSRKLFAEAVKEVVPTEPGEQVRMA
jgi:ABC-type antimicrobial peptide transport system permease subunit